MGQIGLEIQSFIALAKADQDNQSANTTGTLTMLPVSTFVYYGIKVQVSLADSDLSVLIMTQWLQLWRVTVDIKWLGIEGVILLKQRLGVQLLVLPRQSGTGGNICF